MLVALCPCEQFFRMDGTKVMVLTANEAGERLFKRKPSSAPGTTYAS